MIKMKMSNKRKLRPENVKKLKKLEKGKMIPIGDFDKRYGLD